MHKRSTFRVLVSLFAAAMMAACSGGSKSPTSPSSTSTALEYRVSGTGAAISAGLTYANCSAGTSQSSDASLPWSFTCTSIPSGQFLYISAQNNRNSGCVKSQIYKRGVLYKESESCGAYVIATASGTY